MRALLALLIVLGLALPCHSQATACNSTHLLDSKISYRSSVGVLEGTLTASGGRLYRTQKYLIDSPYTFASKCTIETVSNYTIGPADLSETIISCKSTQGNCTANCPPVGFTDRVTVQFDAGCTSGNFTFPVPYPYIAWNSATVRHVASNFAVFLALAFAVAAHSLV